MARIESAWGAVAELTLGGCDSRFRSQGVFAETSNESVARQKIQMVLNILSALLLAAAARFLRAPTYCVHNSNK